MNKKTKVVRILEDTLGISLNHEQQKYINELYDTYKAHIDGIQDYLLIDYFFSG